MGEIYGKHFDEAASRPCLANEMQKEERRYDTPAFFNTHLRVCISQEANQIRKQTKKKQTNKIN